MPTPANHTILVDSNGRPIPQYFVPGVGFKPLKGAGDNGPEYIIKSSALPTGAATEDKQDALIAKDFATQTTLAAILAKIIEAPATEAKQTALAALIGEVQASPTANTLLARLKSLEDKIAAIDSVLDAIVDGSAPAVTQLSGSNMELYGASINDRPAANTVPAGATFTIVDRDLDKNWISDGTNWEEV